MISPQICRRKASRCRSSFLPDRHILAETAARHSCVVARSYGATRWNAGDQCEPVNSSLAVGSFAENFECQGKCRDQAHGSECPPDRPPGFRFQLIRQQQGHSGPENCPCSGDQGDFRQSQYHCLHASIYENSVKCEIPDRIREQFCNQACQFQIGNRREKRAEKPGQNRAWRLVGF